MDKLELDLDDLEVKSFSPEQQDVPREGTVHGQELESSVSLPWTWYVFTNGCCAVEGE